MSRHHPCTRVCKFCGKQTRYPVSFSIMHGEYFVFKNDILLSPDPQRYLSIDGQYGINLFQFCSHGCSASFRSHGVCGVLFSRKFVYYCTRTFFARWKLR